MEKLRVTGSKLPCVIRGEGEALRHLRQTPAPAGPKRAPQPPRGGGPDFKEVLKENWPRGGFSVPASTRHCQSPLISV